MPRTRSIKPEFWDDEKLSKVSRDARLTFIGLWTQSDDYGTCKGNPTWLKSKIFPFDERLKIQDFIGWLKELEAGMFIVPFQGNGESYYFIRNFNRHQIINRPSHQRNPEPPSGLTEGSVSAHGVLIDETETESETETETETETYSPASEDVRLVQLLVDLMLQNNPESSIIKKLTPARQAEWINQCRLLREADERTPEQIEALIRWSQQDRFWKTNILSIAKLREKWDQLWIKARMGDKFSGIRAFVNEDNDDKQ